MQDSEFGIVYFPTDAEIEKLGWYVTHTVTMATTPHYQRTRLWDPITHTHLWEDGRRSPYFVLYRIEEGGAECRTEHLSHANLGVGDMLLVTPYQWYAFRPSPETGSRETYVIFDGSDPRWLLRNGCISARSPILRPGDSQEIERAFGSIRDFTRARNDQAGSPMQQYWISSLVHSALCAALNSMPRDGGSVPYESIPRDVLGLKCYLDDNLCSDLDIGQMAIAASRAITGIRRRFRRFMGTSPHQYHLEARMSLARKMLLESDRSIMEIANTLGFQDRCYFTRVFRRHYGCCPEQWREMHLSEA